MGLLNKIDAEDIKLFTVHVTKDNVIISNFYNPDTKAANFTYGHFLKIILLDPTQPIIIIIIVTFI